MFEQKNFKNKPMNLNSISKEKMAGNKRREKCIEKTWKNITHHYTGPICT